MSTPAPALSLTASSDETSYQPGATITLAAAALQALAVAATVSASLAGATVNVEVDFSVEEPAAGATFGISDSTNGQISWTQAPGSAPGSIVFTATAPSAASAA
jgi:hypothetical protein